MTAISIPMTADTFDVGPFTYEVISYENSECRLIGTNTEISGEVIIPDNVRFTFQRPDEVGDEIYDMAVTEIGDHALSGKNEVVKFVFGNSITLIGEGSFQDNNALEEVVMNNSLVNIGKWAFIGCTILHSIDIPDSVTEIGEGAFGSNYWLESVKMGNNITTIPSFCFNACSNLIEFTCPDNLKGIESFAFQNCSLLQNFNFNDDLEYIGEYAFGYCENLLEVNLPAKIKSIEPWTFSHCRALETIKLGEQITSIGEYAFGWCSSLTDINIPASVKTIEKGGFQACTNLTTVTGCEGLESIGENSFSGDDWNNISLQFISLSDNLKNIGAYAFTGNSQMTEFTVPKNVTDIGTGAFENMYALTFIELNEAIERIPDEMCANSPVKNIVIPESIKTIGDRAFQWCGLENVTFGKNLESIGSYSFQSCQFTDVSIPDATTVIEDGAFADCYNLKAITLGAGISKIKPYVFSNLSLEMLECRAVTPPTVFSETFTDWQYENTTLKVPDESLDAYGNKAYWKKFLNRIGNAVEGIGINSTTQDVRYDLNGRRVDDSYKGISIIRKNDGTTEKSITR